MATRTIRLFSMNAYLIPGWFVNQNNATCQRQGDRARGIGELASKIAADVITLQEIWGSNTCEIERSLSHTHHVLPSCRSWGSTWIDAPMQWMLKRGGLWLAYSRCLSLLKECKCTYQTSNTLSGKGIISSLFDTGLYWGPESRLIVCTTHLDPSNRNSSQDCQLDEIKSFLRTSLVQYLSLQLIPDLSKCGLLLTGDFNIPTHDTARYQRLLAATGGRDLLADLDPSYTYDSTENSLCQWGSTRIDYVFGVDNVDNVGKLAALTPTEACVLRGRELSDHWGLTCTLQMNNNCSS